MNDQRSAQGQPAASAIREQLQRMLGHEPFARSPVLSRFLTRVVEHFLSGDAPPLKEYTLGLEVFDRANDFDPRTDTIVRVQARRLREALARYYSDQGRRDPIRLDMPKGQYGIRVSRSRFDAGKATTRNTAARRLRPRALILAGIVIASALVVIGLWFETPGTRPLVVAPRVPAPTARKSVAVLPFANLSNDVRNAFFARGMQDEILSDLARVADLKVISRTSVMKYEGISKRNMHEIANAIGATYVIEGSVQRVDDRIRVTAQLIDARHDAHLWADHYDREVTDVFAIQSEIASKIADQLRARLSPRERAAIRRAPTTDLRAYELYDQARNMLVWNDPQGAGNSLKRKASLLKQAIQRDPDFALAYCALAKVQDELFVALGSRMHLKAARKSLDTALRLQPNLGDAHRELGRYYYWSGELDRAYNELMAVSRIWPNDAETFRLLGEIDRENGRWRDSLDNLRKANDLDPRNGEYIHHLQLTYRLMRRYAEGLQFVNEAFARDPQYPAWHWLYLAEYKLDEGHPDQAHQALAHLPLSFSPTPEVWETRYRTALYLRDYDEASRIVAQTPKKWAAAVYIGNPPRSAADGLIARLRGNAPEAKSIFLAARKTIKHMFLQSVIYKFMEPAQYGLLDAELGRTAKAVSEARHAVDLMPVSRNSLEGPSVVGNLAVVYALTGKPDQALNQLESIIEIPAGPSYGELRFDPRWDTLRGNPRFEKMVARVKPHSN